jgi:methionyl-tRNA formyltransferase
VRTAYLGTSDFAATVLRRLADSPHRPSLVLTPPDSRRGRGRRERPAPAAEVAAELGLETMKTGDVNAAEPLASIAAGEPEAVIVCAFGQLIREPLLSAYPLLNLHPSLLPRWRGAAPIERAIMAGDEVTGVCVMRLTAGLDSGPVALREEVPIGPEDDFEALSARLAERGGELLVRALDLQAVGELEFVEQPEDGVTYAEKIEPGERRLDPSRPAGELADTVRALASRLGTYLEIAGEGEPERLGVKRASALAPGVPVPDLAPGAVAVVDGSLLVGCSPGVLRLELVQPAGGKPMPVDAYLRGHEVPVLAS